MVIWNWASEKLKGRLSPLQFLRLRRFVGGEDGDVMTPEQTHRLFLALVLLSGRILNVEEALATLEHFRAAWDTPQIQELRVMDGRYVGIDSVPPVFLDLVSGKEINLIPVVAVEVTTFYLTITRQRAAELEQKHAARNVPPQDQ